MSAVAQYSMQCLCVCDSMEKDVQPLNLQHVLYRLPPLLPPSPTHTSGVFWHNAAETWVDVTQAKAGQVRGCHSRQHHTFTRTSAPIRSGGIPWCLRDFMHKLIQYISPPSPPSSPLPLLPLSPSSLPSLLFFLVLSPSPTPSFPLPSSFPPFLSPSPLFSLDHVPSPSPHTPCGHAIGVCGEAGLLLSVR